MRTGGETRRTSGPSFELSVFADSSDWTKTTMTLSKFKLSKSSHGQKGRWQSKEHESALGGIILDSGELAKRFLCPNLDDVAS